MLRYKVSTQNDKVDSCGCFTIIAPHPQFHESLHGYGNVGFCFMEGLVWGLSMKRNGFEQDGCEKGNLKARVVFPFLSAFFQLLGTSLGPGSLCTGLFESLPKIERIVLLEP